MTLFRTTLLVAPLALALGAGSLMAQDAPAQKFNGGFKARVGVSAGHLKQDMDQNKLLGAGLYFSYNLGKGSDLIGEIGYLHFFTNPYINPLPAPYTSATSADSRKNHLEGFTIRLGYRGAIGDTGWSWQAGGSIDRMKSRQEVSGALTNGSVTEPLAVTPEASKTNLGAFAGMQTFLGKDFSLEINLVTVGYSKVNWVPSYTSGRPAFAETTNRRGLALEVGFGFNF